MRMSPLGPWIGAKMGATGTDFGPAELERYQLERLRATIRLARDRSPFYRDLFAHAGPEPESLADLARFPFTTAEDLRSAPLRLLCVSQDEIDRVVTLDSSGTTGPAKRVYFTRADQDLTVDFFDIGMRTLAEPGDTVAILAPCERVGGIGDLLARGLERLGARPIRHGVVRDVDQTLAMLRDEHVDVLVGIPSQVLALARYGPGPGVRNLLLSWDNVPAALVDRVERAWGCRVYNHYGTTEMGLGGGVECEARRGYHLREADLYVEIVDPGTGLPVPEGELGEVVFSTLTRTGMPLIRYRMGDLGRFIPGPCPCGAPLRTLARIRTRVAGQVPLGRSAVLTMPELDEALFALDDVLDFEVAVLDGPDGTARLRLEVRAVQTAGPQLTEQVEAAVASVPAVKLAIAAGELTTSVSVQPTRTVTARPIKRAIQDVRNHA